jgi:hypothetical protein
MTTQSSFMMIFDDEGVEQNSGDCHSMGGPRAEAACSLAEEIHFCSGRGKQGCAMA